MKVTLHKLIHYLADYIQRKSGPDAVRNIFHNTPYHDWEKRLIGDFKDLAKS